MNNPYILKLYVVGLTLNSSRAIANIEKLCKKYLKQNYTLKVIDLYQNPKLAKSKNIIVVPTLIKESPQPERRFVGDLSNELEILKGLNWNASE